MPNVLLIALTGHTDQSDRELTRSAGFDYHMGKPIDLHELVSLLKQRTVGGNAK
jgi:CheY-like chemotaxis protein